MGWCDVCVNEVLGSRLDLARLRREKFSSRGLNSNVIRANPRFPGENKLCLPYKEIE